MITDEMKKDLDAVVETIINRCRSGHQPHLSKGMAYEQLRGALLVMTFINGINNVPNKPVGDFTSCKLEDEYLEKINREM